MAIGGVPGNSGQVGGNQASQSRAGVKEMVALMKDLMSNIKEITTQEIGGMRAMFTKGEVNDGTQQSGNTQIGQQAKQQSQVSQPLHRSAAADQNPQDAALAALLADDEVDGKKNKKKLAFEKRMEQMEQLESILGDVEFDNPEHKAEMEAFFSTMKKLRSAKQEYSRLSYQEKKLEEQLERQEAQFAEDEKEKKEAVVAKRDGVNTPSFQAEDADSDEESISHEARHLDIEHKGPDIDKDNTSADGGSGGGA